MASQSTPELKVASEVWIVTALLHREHPDRQDFSIKEILERAAREKLTPKPRGSTHVHIIQHCVANRSPNPARHRMLVETGPGRRRLYRPGDPVDHRRADAKAKPERAEIPESYQYLLDWYDSEYVRQNAPTRADDPLLALSGSGRQLWANEGADAYVRRLREGWE